MPETEMVDTAGAPALDGETDGHVPMVDDDLLIEEVSIDGMCGVY